MAYLNLFSVLYISLALFWFKSGTVEGIVGGEEVLAGKYDYMVSVQADGQHICGGVFIDYNYVLTAAQCFTNDDNLFLNKKYTVITGVVDLNNVQTVPGYSTDVKTIFIPSEYRQAKRNDKTDYYYDKADIAVIKLSTSLGSLLSMVKLPEKVSYYYSKFVGETAYVSGFGSTKLKRGIKRNNENVEIANTDSRRLKAAKVLVVPKIKCKSMFPFPIEDYYLCGQVEQHKHELPEGACDGDVGSPLVLNPNTVIGVLVQTRTDCNEQFGASLYTRVSIYANFINSILTHMFGDNVRIAIYKLATGESSSGTSENPNRLELIEVTTSYYRTLLKNLVDKYYQQLDDQLRRV